MNDVSVINPAAPSFVKQSSTRVLSAAGTRERQKDTLYLERCRRQGILFFPCVLEAFGGFGARCINFVDLLCEEGIANGVTSISGLSLKQFLLCSLSFSLQTGNAIVVMEAARKSRERLH